MQGTPPRYFDTTQQGDYAGEVMDTRNDPSAARVVELSIDGMTCGGCVRSVRNVPERIPGVCAAEIPFENAQTTLTCDPA